MIELLRSRRSIRITTEDYLQELPAIPAHYKILSIVTIGNPQKERIGKPTGELQYEKIHTNRF